MNENVAQKRSNDRLRDIPEAAEFLNVPEGWLRKAVSAKKVPYTKLGKHVRFTPAHLEAIVTAGESAPARPSRGSARSKL